MGEEKWHVLLYATVLYLYYLLNTILSILHCTVILTFLFFLPYVYDLHF